MMERSIHAANVPTRQIQNVAKHQQAKHEGQKYPCGECDYQATVNGTSTKHRRAVHAGNAITTQGQKKS